MQDISRSATLGIIRLDQTWSIPSNWHNAMLAACNRFAGSMNEESEFYRQTRNARDPKLNIMIGKYGEVFAMQCLTAMGFPSIPVDFAVYGVAGKSWAADLPYRALGTGLPDVHVKTCDIDTVRYVSGKLVNGQTVGRYSWTFNIGSKTGIGGRDTAISSKQDVVALVYIPTLQARSGTLVATVPTSMLSGLLKPPISDKLVGIKACIYDSQLPSN